jgi:taurine dioxygenase
MSTATLPTEKRSGPRVAARTPADWTATDYTRFTLRPVAPTIGAEVGGLSLAEPLDDELRHQLNQALLEWKVLLFRDQNLTREQQAAFGRHWGDLEQHPFAKESRAFADRQDADAPDVVRLEKDEMAKGQENLWHADVTWRVNPSMGAVLRAIEVPEVGGDTLWADMGAAYDLLPQEVKDRIDGMVAVHDWIDTFGRAMDPAKRDALRPDFPAIEHPVVRTHPETGRRTLFVNSAFTQHIVGLDPDESAELLSYLYRQAAYPEYQCRFRWTPGAVAFWDNRAAQHYASSDYFPQRRVMERVSIVGDRPY